MNFLSTPPIHRLLLVFVVTVCMGNCAGHELQVPVGDRELKTEDKNLRLNQIQVVGTHNSYHLAPSPEIMKIIRIAGKGVADSIDYSHPPLEKQFGEYGVRQIELDIYADPEGGLYSNPIGRQLAGQTQSDPRLPFDFESVMKQPGAKIIHAPGFDFATQVPTLKAALEQTVSWSKAHPNHLPILILLELKEKVAAPAGVNPIRFDREKLDALDQEILGCVPRDMLLTPDAVRGKHATLREAIETSGWPTLDRCCGKIFFALDNTDSLKDRYLEGHDSLKGRVMFVSVGADQPAAAWMKLNDPVHDFKLIQECVQKGFLVRTRADSDTRQARDNDPSQRDRAIESGAQFISTDFPVPDTRWSDYCLQWPGRAVYRRNPISCR